MQKIVPFLWFNGNIEEAILAYTSYFKNSSVSWMNRKPDGKIFTSTFLLAGSEFMAVDGGPYFKFTPAISFFVNCETEAELDELWNNLAADGSVMMPLGPYPFSKKFGWVQDRFGLSWQLNLTGTQQKVTPFLLFANEKAGKAEEAAGFYVSEFQHSEINRMEHYAAGEGGAEGTVKHGAFSLDGLSLMVMDSNMPHAFGFTPAVSFFVNCDTQEEVDTFWERLSEGGKKECCGWLVDRYGVSWQIVPTALGRLLYDKDQERSGRVMQAMLKMIKLDIKGLEDAYAGNA